MSALNAPPGAQVIERTPELAVILAMIKALPRTAQEQVSHTLSQMERCSPM